MCRECCVTLLAVLFLRLYVRLVLLLSHRDSLTQIADHGVLKQRAEHHHETGAQEDVDRFDVRDLGQLGIRARHERGHGEHLEGAVGEKKGQLAVWSDNSSLSWWAHLQL